MKIRVSILLALRFLGIGAGKSTSNARKSLYGAIAGIGISLVPLVIVLVVANGMIEGISSRVIELSTSHLRAADYAGLSGLTENSADIESLCRSIPKLDPNGSIESAFPEKQGIGIVIGTKGRSGATIRALDSGFFTGNKKVEELLEVVDGTLESVGPNDAILGKKMASEIGVKVGDSFRILTMRSGPSGNSIPRFSSFTLRAIISSGYQELDALWVIVPFKAGFRILSDESSNLFINVRTGEPFSNLEPLRKILLESLPEGFTVYTWKELNRSQFQSFTTLRSLLLFIMLLIVFVASVNVSSALVMLVMERRREIAILKSTGASPSGITFAFLLAGFLTGLGGVIAGIPAGIYCAIHINSIFFWMEKAINSVNAFLYLLARAFIPSGGGGIPAKIHLLDPAYYLEVIPVTLRGGELFLIASGTIVLSVLVSLLPAMHAGREKPLDTLRKF
jgi:lipoprotein-releasing system permease protein